MRFRRLLHPLRTIRDLERERDLLIERCVDFMRERDLAVRQRDLLSKALGDSTRLLREATAELEARKHRGGRHVERDPIGRTVGRA